MRGDQPERRLASPMVIHARIRANLIRVVSRFLRRRGAFAPVPVFEPHDVVQVIRRDLDHERVLERGHAVHRARPEAERVVRPDLERLELPSYLAELEARTSFLDEPRLVLLLVLLQAQRLTGPDEEELPRVLVRLGPDELPPPWLLHPARRRSVAAARRLAHENRSDSSGMRCPAPIRSPWSSTFPLPTTDPGPTTARFESAQPEPSSTCSPTMEPTTLAPDPMLA